jgi:VacB/RNase II family 3'-5' exoribonuclease
MNDIHSAHLDLQATAKQLMQENGFEAAFSPQVDQQVAQLKAHPPPISPRPDLRDLRNLVWSSIDNDTSRDLDQIEVAVRQPNGEVKVMVGIADVDAFVPKNSSIDQHAAKQTATIYAGVRNFSMLPEELSTGLTSLLENEDRLSIVIEFVVDADGNVNSGNLYRAVVRNRAQLTYNAVGAWLQGPGPAPAKVAASSELASQLKLQDTVAQALKNQRFRHGALNLESSELQPVLVNQQVVDVVGEQKNNATELIEDLMIAANGVVARSLEKVSSLRRIVKTPEHWDRIVQIAALHGEKLPAQPDSKALNDFLLHRKAADPDYFAALSLEVIKLIGPGEYVLERPGDPEEGHFGLAVRDYTHSTAPNRRFADLVNQRLVKAMLDNQPSPYTDEDLTAIAMHCNLQESAGVKVERAIRKRAAAVALANSIGRTFRGVVTGASEKGVYVRVFNPPVEGRVMQGEQGLEVGDIVTVTLLHTDPQRAFIDFKVA